jgi:molybdopterin-containing oxidoreductase family iron-sulfur binding subunit
MQRAGTPDLTAIRERMRGTGGKVYWRSLEAAAETPEFQEYLHREFPQNATEWLDPVGRRTFLKLMSASLALAGIGAACTAQPRELIVPYVRQPEEEIPGRPLFYSTAMTLGGVATGLLVESHQGRPTKVEGNPDHPGSLGATDLYAQASVLTLYDPDRSRVISQLGEIRPWNGFITAVRAGLSAQAATKGAGLRILTETIASPTLASQLQQVIAAYPGAKWIQWEPVPPADNSRAGLRQAVGRYVQPLYDFSRANVVVSLDADFLAAEGAANLRYARQFSSRRRLDAEPDRLNRLYVAEPTPSVTGLTADHKIPIKASYIESFARAIASAVGAAGAGTPGPLGAPEGTQPYVDAIVQDLQAHRGAAIVMAGEAQPPSVHALVHAINQALGNIGATITYVPPPEIVPSEQHAALGELVSDMNAGRVQMLLIIGESNPVQTAPADLNFADAISKVQTRFHSSLFLDETATLCHWHVPAAHFLEAWSDARTIDGTVSIVQPLIEPLYGGKSAHEIVQTLLERPERNGYDIVREFWAASRAASAASAAGAVGAAATGATPTVAPALPAGQQAGESRQGSQPAEQNVAAMVAQQVAPPPPTADQRAAALFDRNWRRWLHDGFIPGTAFADASAAPTFAPGGASVGKPGAPAPGAAGAPSALSSVNPIPGIEVNFRRDPTIYDGRFANNGWLQELPKPVTKLTWDNAALIAPSTAERLGLDVGDVIQIAHEGRQIRVPVFITPGQAQDAITVSLGYGRSRAGRVGNATGFNGYVLRGSNNPWFGAAEIRATGDHYELVTTQNHWTLEGRNIVRSTTLETFKANPAFAKDMEHLKLDRPITLYPAHDYSQGYQWGMAIDMNTCTGCSACVIACVSENNIPVVGKEQVGRNREMHWLRVDRYYTGSLDNPDTFTQPLPCMQCENAPCEVVCPVAATVHSDEGLNDMVYNRCVGTRYCSNNCPYKVRRFNFLLYADWDTPSFKMQRNPDVTVRSRGVMEKCTYCVQRINHARQQAKIDVQADGSIGRSIRDGEVLTACQSVCPTDSIVFGNINDANSRVSQLKRSPRNYAMLDELNTRPRTTYLAAVRNPHPSLPHHANVGGHDTDHDSGGASEQH